MNSLVKLMCAACLVAGVGCGSDARSRDSSAATEVSTPKKDSGTVAALDGPNAALDRPATTVDRSTCSQLSGQTIRGLVMLKVTDPVTTLTSQFDLQDQASVTRYTVKIDLFGGTQVINLKCKECPNQFIQVDNWVVVAGATSGTSIAAKTIQVETFKDGP